MHLTTTYAESLSLCLSPVDFSQAAREFLDWKESEHRDHWATGHRIRTSFVSLLKFFNGRMIAELTPARIESYKLWRRQTVKDITLRHDLHALSLFFQFAMSSGWSHANPVRQVRIPSDKDAMRFYLLSAADEQRYFNCAARRFLDLYDLGRLMLHQGMRPSEVLSLRKTDVDADHQTVRIAAGKTRAARRVLKLTPDSFAIVMRRAVTTGSSPWLFPGRAPGTHLVHLARSHKTVLKETGLHFVIYDFRHTFATRMAHAGTPVATLAAILGHGSLRCVLRYVHPSQAEQDEAILKFWKSSKAS